MNITLIFSECESIMEEISIDEFLLFNQNNLVSVFSDNSETGNFRLLETEKDLAAKYENEGYKIRSIMEGQDGEETVIEGINTSPYCVGYFICKP